MIDIDEELALLNGGTDGPTALEAGAIGGDNQIEFFAGLGLVEEFFGVHEGQLAGQNVLVPAGDFLALVLQGHGEAELGADAIAIGPDVAHHTNGFALADGVQNPLDQAGGFHELVGDCFSSSSIMARTLFPRATESSMTKRNCGV